jgi:hypothetical protein
MRRYRPRRGGGSGPDLRSADPRCAAQQAGVEVRFARDAASLAQAAAGARLVLLDLDARWLDIAGSDRAHCVQESDGGC